MTISVAFGRTIQLSLAWPVPEQEGGERVYSGSVARIAVDGKGA